MKKVLIFFLAVALFVLYVFVDNNRIKKVFEKVYIADLPSSFEGFTILQITDLHGKYFGKNQKLLLDKVNSIDYDALFITGDMMSRKKDDSALNDFLKGLNNKEYVFYDSGNHGPFAFDSFSGQVFPEGEKLEDLGCKLLNNVYSIKKGNDTLWITPHDFIRRIDYVKTSFDKKDDKEIYDYYERLERSLDDIKPTDPHIGISHYPLSKELICETEERFKDTFNYDLLVSGHYHGGQYRIPFYGALFVPTYYEPRKLFPDREMVDGLYTYNNLSQYVSRGLGATDYIPFLQFRLFNTPEINILTLHKK